MITVDVIGRKHGREIKGSFTGMAEHVWALIDGLAEAGWVIAHMVVP